MIKKYFLPESKKIPLPRVFNADTMTTFTSQVIDDQRKPIFSRITFDFGNSDFIEPVGVVILSNVIEYLKSHQCKIDFIGHTQKTVVTKFLDDSLFFDRYLNKKIFPDSSVRETTIPLKLIDSEHAQDYLLNTIMPWVGKSVNMIPSSLDIVRVALEEVLHNVSDHSGVKIGCTFAQHFPQKKRIQIAISDFGAGIPNVVRKVKPGLNDSAAIRQACEEGFTTKSNVKNRGAGLPTLIRYVTENNGGNVLISAGCGNISAAPTPRGNNPFKITTRTLGGFYPGTLVRVILRTDTLERAVEDISPEKFEW